MAVRRSVLVHCLVLLATMTLLFQDPAGAAPHHAKKRAVPTCSSSTMRSGDYAYFDAGLYRAMNHLVCGAADHSTIQVKSWFMMNDGPAPRAFIHNLHLMHKYHHVRVYIQVGSERYAHLRISYRQFVKSMRGIATVSGCHGGCVRPGGKSVSHSKWITVSKLRRGGKTAVLQTSANFAQHQLRGTHEDGVLIVNNVRVYRAFTHEFAVYRQCSVRHHCRGRAYPGHWTRSGAISVHFTPTVEDLTADELARVSCARGGRVLAVSRVFNDSRVLRQLNRIRAAGCQVRIVAEYAPHASASPLKPRCLPLHEKFIAFDTPALREVYAGAKDLASGKYQVNDNQEVLVRSASILRAYQKQFAMLWARSKSC